MMITSRQMVNMLGAIAGALIAGLMMIIAREWTVDVLLLTGEISRFELLIFAIGNASGAIAGGAYANDIYDRKTRRF